MSEIGSWSAWSGSPVRRTVDVRHRRKGRPRVSVQREIQIEIRALEERLANPAPETSREAFAPIFADGFREFGSSGRVFDEDMVLTALDGVTRKGSRGPITLEGFRVERVATNVVLATYLARVPAGPGWKPPSLRSSLWCKRDGRWQILFHQGTPTPAEGPAR